VKDYFHPSDGAPFLRGMVVYNKTLAL